MANCRQACPYNTLDGCKVKEYNAICPISNMATPITEYRITNADRIRSMTDDELAEFLCGFNGCYSDKCPGAELCEFGGGLANGLKKWLQQPVEVT